MTMGATKPRVSVPPCVRCKTTAGACPIGRPVPARMSLARFGIEGRGCKRCYNELDRKASRPADKLPGSRTRLGLSEPDRRAMAEARREKLRNTPLPILDPWFKYEHLIDRVKVQLLIREARREGRL